MEFPAAKYLQPGDQIVSINNKGLSTEPKKLLPAIRDLLIKPLKEVPKNQLQIKVLRKENMHTITLPIESKELNEQLINSFELKKTKIEGEYEQYPFFTAISKGIQTTNQWIYQIIYSIKHLISERSLKGAGGPIMIISKTFETAQQGLIPLLIFLAFISINLAIINILPIGALDGGQVLFATIEAIIRREIPEMIRLVINIASWVLLLSLILYLSYKDVLRIIFNKM